MFKKGDLVEVSFWDYKTNKRYVKNGLVTGRFLSRDFTLEEGLEVLIDQEKRTVRIGDCRCVNPE